MIRRDAKILCRRLRRRGTKCRVAKLPRDHRWGVQLATLPFLIMVQDRAANKSVDAVFPLMLRFLAFGSATTAAVTWKVIAPTT